MLLGGLSVARLMVHTTLSVWSGFFVLGSAVMGCWGRCRRWTGLVGR